ncbi:MAG: gfo/Idh/MocA family oxidoreductase, partial [Verrucomicrobia bacterium]
MNRRTFLQSATAAGILAQAPFILAQKPNRKWRIALIGT